MEDDATSLWVAERGLWAEVLRLAVTDLRGAKRERDAGRCYLLDDVDRVGSMRWICSLFDIDPERVRAQLRGRLA